MCHGMIEIQKPRDASVDQFVCALAALSVYAKHTYMYVCIYVCMYEMIGTQTPPDALADQFVCALAALSVCLCICM
jgi:hypothetical protein